MFFEQKVDRRSRQAMVNFLLGHYRYNTMSSINRSTSYAHCVKVSRLGLTNQQIDNAFEILSTDFWHEIEAPIDEFTLRHNGAYTIGSNGRSAGYLVLYNSRFESTGHKSHCRTCGQKNFRKVAELDMTTPEGILRAEVIRNGGCWTAETYLGQEAVRNVPGLSDEEKLVIIRSAKRNPQDFTLGNKCGRCGTEGSMGRVNYSSEPKRLSTYPGQSIDVDLAYEHEDWSLASLRDRVDLICDFDRTCDEIRDNFLRLVNEYQVQEITVMVPKKVRQLVEKGASL